MKDCFQEGVDDSQKQDDLFRRCLDPFANSGKFSFLLGENGFSEKCCLGMFNFSLPAENDDKNLRENFAQGIMSKNLEIKFQ